MCVFNFYILEKSVGNIPALEYKVGGEPDNVIISIPGKKWLQRRTSKQLIFGTAILMLVMVSVIALVVALLTTRDVPLNRSTLSDIGEEVGGRPANDPEEKLEMVSRLEWVASPPSKTVPLKRPVQKVIISETDTVNCHGRHECVFIVRHLQWNHMDGRSFWDIKYNFLIGGDGSIFHGRGWEHVAVPYCNENAVEIALVGEFSLSSPTDFQTNATQKLIRFGVNSGHISKNYILVTASQLLGEDNGSSKELDKEVQNWPHGSSTDYFSNDSSKQQFCTSFNRSTTIILKAEILFFLALVLRLYSFLYV